MRMLKVECEEALATIEDLHAENDALHKSIEESMELSSGINDTMEYFVESVKSSEEKENQFEGGAESG